MKKNIKNKSEHGIFIKEISGVKYFDDAISTTPASSVKTVDTFLDDFPESRIILVCGGTDKGLKYDDFTKIIKERVDEIIILPGTASEKIKKGLGNYTRIHDVLLMPEAVKVAKKLSKKGDVVIFSPASVDSDNKLNGGKQFIEAIKKMSK